MSDKYITEILPDLDKMPEWARKAFEEGQFFNAAFKLVEKLEKTITALESEKAELVKHTTHLDGCHITVIEGVPKMCSCHLNERLSKQEQES